MVAATFATRLAALMEQSDHSYRQLAEYLDISHSSVGKYVKGGALPRGNILTRIAQLYGVDPRYLMDGKAPESGGKVADWLGKDKRSIQVQALADIAYTLPQEKFDVVMALAKALEKDEA